MDYPTNDRGEIEPSMLPEAVRRSLLEKAESECPDAGAAEKHAMLQRSTRRLWAILHDDVETAGDRCDVCGTNDPDTAWLIVKQANPEDIELQPIGEFCSTGCLVIGANRLRKRETDAA